MSKLENSKRFRFEKFRKNCSLKKYENFKNFRFNKLSYISSVRIIRTNIKIRIQKIDLYQRTNMRINKISSGAEYSIDEKLQNLSIFRAKFWFFKLKNSINSLIFHILKF